MTTPSFCRFMVAVSCAPLARLKISQKSSIPETIKNGNFDDEAQTNYSSDYATSKRYLSI